MNGLSNLEVALTIFFSGMIFATFLASGLFFFKFGKRTREPFFAMFAYACWMLAFERLPLLFFGPDAEGRPWVFLMRLFAFFLIIVSFVSANRKRIG